MPPAPGTETIARVYTGPRSRSAAVPDARLVLTPVNNAAASIRVLGGLAWYLGRRTPAWLTGAGLRFFVRGSSLVLDVERWHAGVPLDIRRIRVDDTGQAEVTTIGSDRAWQAFWQYRIGVSIWTH